MATEISELQAKKASLRFKKGHLVMGLYQPGVWELCTIIDVTSDGYNVWFHVDSSNEFRDLRAHEVVWAVAKITAEQQAQADDLALGSCYPCELVADQPDQFDRWHVRLWQDIETLRPRTFLLPSTLVRTGSENAKPIVDRSWCCGSCTIL